MTIDSWESRIRPLRWLRRGIDISVTVKHPQAYCRAQRGSSEFHNPYSLPWLWWLESYKLVLEDERLIEGYTSVFIVHGLNAYEFTVLLKSWMGSYGLSSQ